MDHKLSHEYNAFAKTLSNQDLDKYMRVMHDIVYKTSISEKAFLIVFEIFCAIASEHTYRMEKLKSIISDLLEDEDTD